MKNSGKPTASWLYELDSSALGTVGSADAAYLLGILGKLQRCISVLMDAGLLIPSHVVLMRWIDIIGDKKLDIENEIKQLDIDHASGTQLDMLILSAINLEQHPGKAIRPTEIVVHGRTNSLGANGGVESASSLLSVNAQFMGGGSMEVRLFGDIWLPFSFDGKVQNSSFEKAALALEQALAEIEKSLTAAPIFDDHSDLAEIHGYRLNNLTDGDGGVIAIDSSGTFL